MSSSDPKPGSVDRSAANLLLTLDERNDTRQSIVKAEAELQRIETDITKLLERQEEVRDNLSQLKNSLVIHRILPNDTISYIFSLMRAEKVPIPHKRYMTPSQITVSHVCSKWREIALATPALWSDVAIMQPGSNQWVHIAQELLFDRASTRGVNLSLNMEDIGSKEMRKVFYKIILPLHVKKLHLILSLSALEDLSQESADIIANVDEIGLSITPPSGGVPPQSDSSLPSDPSAWPVSVAPQFLTRIRSLMILRRGGQGSFIRQLDLQTLPWAQIHHLNCGTSVTLSTLSDILHQSPALEVCEVKVKLDDAVELPAARVMTLPQLRVFHIFPDHDSPRSDEILRSFQCPNLTEFRVRIPHWTPDTHNIIENHYNLRRVLKLEVSEYPYPISKALITAPMLRELVVINNSDKVFMDEKALQGISSGKLGRHLTSLGFVGNLNVRRVLDTVTSRQRRVNQIVKASHSWHEQQISSIKQIFVLNNYMENCALAEEFEEKTGELEELDVVVYNPCEGLGSGSEELAWPGNDSKLSWQNICDFPQPNCSGPNRLRSKRRSAPDWNTGASPSSVVTAQLNRAASPAATTQPLSDWNSPPSSSVPTTQSDPRPAPDPTFEFELSPATSSILYPTMGNKKKKSWLKR